MVRLTEDEFLLFELEHKIIPKIVTSKGFKITDYSNKGFYPAKKFQQGLLELIVFPEQTSKNEIPNGSVWVYDKSTPYNPQILKSDVGCGMTLAVTDLDLNDRKTPFKIIEILKKKQIKIGRGNHFLDFLKGHPLHGEHCTSILLHSDFNTENKSATNYEMALDQIKKAKEKRIDVLKTICEGLKASYVIKENWTHNSVEITPENIIYRKGAINLDENRYTGLLAINPFDGIYLYKGKNPDTYNSMPHGVGKKSSNNASCFDVKKVITYGNFEIWDIENSQRPKNLDIEYHDWKVFLHTFGKYQLPFLSNSNLKPKFVVHTG
jgi:hypothetical protein